MNPFKCISLLLLIMFFVSCNQHSSETTEAALYDSASVGIPDQSIKMVKTATIRTKVKDIETGVLTLSRIVQQHRGMIFHQSISSNQIQEKELALSNDSLLIVSSYAPVASVTVRVPAENLQQFLFDASLIGYQTDNSSLDIKDKSLEYLQNRLKQDNRKFISAKINPVHNVKLKDEVTDQQVANLIIDADVAYSPVNIELYQNQIIKKEVVANHRLSSYQLPFSTRFFTAIRDGISFFENFVVMLLHLWAFILLGVILYAAYKLYKRHTMQFPTIK